MNFHIIYLKQQFHFSIGKYIVCLFFMAIIILPSCKKMVEVNPPVTGLVSQTVFTSNSTAAAAITGIYTNLINSSGLAGTTSSIAVRMGLSSDELRLYFSNFQLASYFSNSLSSTNSDLIWNNLWLQIFQTNVAIEGVSQSLSLSSKIKGQLIGEAKFMRAFLYFYAVNIYGDVPLLLTTDYRVNASASRTEKSTVYKQIVSDLKDAQANLGDDFVSPSGDVTTERVRPNKAAATALLARVYLYMNNWASAQDEATKIIDNKSQYKLLDNLDDVFLKNSQEAIWQLQPVAPLYNTYDGYTFILTGKPNSTSPVGLSKDLLQAFEAGDNRRSIWTRDTIFDGESFSFSYKYKIKGGNAGNQLVEYLTVLRLSEQYLIRAEARAQTGDLPGAKEDLNIIRDRSGLSSTKASTREQLLDAILHERQVELFLEWGHRWFDLKRTGKINSVMNIVTPTKGGSWNSNWQIYPIPASDILLNPNLKQNSGY